MPVDNRQVSVTTTATALNTPGEGGDYSTDTLVLYNAGSVAAIIGAKGVTTSNGWRGLLPGTVLGVDIGPGEQVFALTASGSTTVDVLKVR